MCLHRRLPLAAALLIASASLAGAQSPNAAPLPAVHEIAAGPRLEQARAGVSVTRDAALEASREASALAVTPQPSITRRRGVPQMIIGGAALLGGAIIGDDVGSIVMLGGLGFGLYGLYLYLQ